MAVSMEYFGEDRSGEALMLYTLSNEAGMSVGLTQVGASLVFIRLPDQNGKIRDVILGYDTAEEYLTQGGCLGSVLGRSANRTAGAKLELEGKVYTLQANNFENNCHSGPDGFQRRVWKIGRISENSVQFLMEDGPLQQGYPGHFTASATYMLTEDGTLQISYEAQCDADTACNMTNHVYFNLGGQDSGDILGTQLKLEASSYTPIADEKAIPTGEIAPVAGTPMDFTKGKTIGQEIDADFAQLRFTGGYDHNFVLKKDKGSLEKFAEAYDPATGICLEAFTDLPGVQFYTANSLPQGRKGKGGAVYGPRSGFCLETQYFPNAINQDGFAKPLLKAGEKFESRTSYKFSVR